MDTSAGVYFEVVDRSTDKAPLPNQTIGVVVGESDKGPLEAVFVRSKPQFLALYGLPDPTKNNQSSMHYSALAFLTESNSLYVRRVAGTGITSGAFDVRHDSDVLNTAVNSTVGWDPGVGEIINNNTSIFRILASSPGSWSAPVKVVIYPDTAVSNGIDGSFFVEVYPDSSYKRPAERYLVHLDYKVNGFGAQINAEEQINGKSQYIKFIQNRGQASGIPIPDYTNPRMVNTYLARFVTGGHDASAAATSAQVVAGWQDFKEPESVDVDILINAGYVNAVVQAELLDIAEYRGTCTAILDVPVAFQRAEDAVSFRNSSGMDTRFGSMYTPDVLIKDSYSNRRLYVPISGYVAAAYAYTDKTFANWWAPAGVDRGNLNALGVIGVRYSYNLDDRNILDANELNPIRVIPGVGIRIWGNNTLQQIDSALSNVSINRMLFGLEKSLTQSGLYQNFNPNDLLLRTTIKGLIENNLKPLVEGQGLYALVVVCDDTNNTVETMAAGDINCLIYLDPVLPAKRIILNAVVNKSGVTFA